MLRMTTGYKKYWIIDGFVLSILCFLSFLYMKSYHVPYLSTDEYGYWGSAAFFAGYDWSNVISTNGFFSWGYGLILSLFLKIFPNGILKFKLAIVLNSFFLYFLYIILQKINLLVNKEISVIDNKLVCAIGLFYCSCVAYIGFSLPECLLTLLFACTAYLMLLYLKTNSFKYAVLLIILSLYSYMVHQRTVILVIINFVFILFSIWINKRESHKKIVKTGICLFLIILIGFLIHEYIKNRIISVEWRTIDVSTGVTVTSQTAEANNYSGIIRILKYVFSEQGIKELFLGFIGKIYYVMLSTFGIPVIFFMNKFKEIISDAKKKRVKTENEFIIYLFFCIYGVLAVSAVATVSATSNSTYLLYGRYTDNVIPVLLCLSISFLLKRQDKKIIFYTFFIYLIIGKIMLIYSFGFEDFTMQKTTISQVGVSVYYDQADKLRPFFAVSVPIVLCVFFIFRNCVLAKKMLFIVFLIYNCVIGYRADFLFTVKETLDNMERVRDITYYIDDKNVKEVTVITGDNGRRDKYGKIIQFLIPELKVELQKYEESNIDEYCQIIISHNDKTYSYDVLYQNEEYTIYKR